MKTLKMDSKVLFLVLIAWTVPSGRAVSFYNQKRTVIPHDEIKEGETSIDLNYNSLTSLGKLEFSRYTQLTNLQLCNNQIATVARSAFTGTSLTHLYLCNNQLTDGQVFEVGALPDLTQLSLYGNNIEFINGSWYENTVISTLALENNDILELPDFTSIADTLTRLSLQSNAIQVLDQDSLSALVSVRFLQLQNNPLTKWSDFTEVGRDATNRELTINTLSMLTTGTTICHFETLIIQNTPAGEVPYVNCSPTGNLQTMQLSTKGLTSLTDLTNLTSFVETASLRTLIFYAEDFSVDFPELPTRVRETLSSLYMPNSRVNTISPDRLANYSLAQLGLSFNRLTTLPRETFHIAASLQLTNNPTWQEFGHAYWSEALCHSSTITTAISMQNNADDFAQYRVMEPIVCGKGTGFNLHLGSRPRCDCSAAWIFRARRNCSMQVSTNIPCVAETWELSESQLNCPERFILHYTDGGSSLESKTSDIINAAGTTKVYVHGQDEICMITDATNSPIVQGEGMVILDAATDVTLHYFENNAEILSSTFPAANPCYIPDNALTDGNIETCQPLNYSSATITFVPRVWPVDQTEAPPLRVWLVTWNLDCSVAFHVGMSSILSTTCPPHDRCRFLSMQNLRLGRDLCEFECDCSEISCRFIVLKVAHIEQAGLCDIIMPP